MATQQQTFDFVGHEQAAKGREAAGVQAAGVQAAGVQGISLTRAPKSPPPEPPQQGSPEVFTAELSAAERPDRQAVLRQLRSKVGCISTAPESNRKATFSTGSADLDRLLPEGGLRVDAITEWVAEAEGSGAASMALVAAVQQLRCPRHGRGPLVVVSDGDQFYPPAAVGLGIPADRIVWVRCSRHADLVWSIDQALRCESVAAVWAVVGARLDDRDARRFQLAAETGRTPGLFLRPAATRHRPSFAGIRLHVANLPHSQVSRSRVNEFRGLPAGGRLLQVTLDRCRGGRLGESVWMQMGDRGDLRVVKPRPQFAHQSDLRENGVCNHETAPVHLASELAHPKISVRRAKRA